ncbi:citrate synthase family protein [Roseococcus pinisoli]|uniref:citrate synthase (unknown stereospecificity) n=1 Tax=Roseococcus pinisoli TaxID=2835040 RepID=A0ABS5QIF7_9PROT|nr:citrate synthase family protein [Roseococcus pinisoli]MBS7813362.1 citrate synthase family protein [Roseococcus pinisoli]
MSSYLTAEEAARRLGVSRQTLYSYVSRGLLRAHGGDDPRRSRYSAEAVERLGAERRRGRKPREVAKATLDWGAPVLESAITLIRDGRFFYRGRDVAELARTATVEEVASLLWDLPFAAALATPAPEGPRGPLDEVLLTRFTLATEDDPTALWQKDPRRLAEGCGALLHAMLGAVLGRPPAAGPLHRQLAAAWRLDAEGAELVRMALILCADHELNASGFTARCVASTGASLRAVVIGGLAALTGSRHGGATARLEALWNGLDLGDPAPQLRRRLAAGEAIPGFGHPLYPEGDIRARVLLPRLLPGFPEAARLIEAVAALTGEPPSVDVALVVLRRALGLPEGTAFGLFALGRTIGWIAHGLEQRARGQLIRPRAIYVGPVPPR